MDNHINVLDEAKKVFDTEINALQKMKESLDGTFEQILKEIVNCKGKIIITGMGKPGHIGTKIAATFASLGMPSFFLHPAEAMHGDLGMVGSDDIVIAISYSGESDEVIRILPNIKMIGAKIIAITSKKDSTLAKYGYIVQVLPSFEEACYLKLAPTSSTTVELCYGDALAVVGSQILQFSDSDFGRLHPAGALGKKLVLKVGDIMSKDENVPRIEENSFLIDAISELTKKRLGIVSIVNESGSLLGIITDADLRKVIKSHANLYEIKTIAAMNSNPKIFRADKLAVDALLCMKENAINVLPIVDDNKKLIGTIHWQQIVKAGIVI